MRRFARLGAVASFMVLGSLLTAPITAASAADASTVPQSIVRATARPVVPITDEPTRMIDVDPGDFVEAGAELPAGLQQALARDVGLSGAEWLAQSEAGNAAADVVADLTEVIEVVDARLEGYDLVVTVETATDARIAESVGARVEFGSALASRVSEPIEGLEAAADLRGGMPYLFPKGSGTFRCSVGFVGTDTVTDELQIMSAGHCEGNTGSNRNSRTITRPTLSGGTLGSTDTLIGAAGLHVTDDYVNPGFLDEEENPVETFYDLGMTPVTNGSWVGKPEVVTWGNSTSGAPLASAPLIIRDAGPAITGSTLCKSGSTTGWTCGAIIDVDEILYVGNGPASCPSPGDDYCVGSIVSTVCVRGGDSGGAAVVGSRAVGITSAATNSTVTSCSVSGNLGVFSTLYSINPAYEQVTKIFPDWEPLIGFDSQLTNVFPRIDESVTSLPAQVIGGSTRHSVSASIDGGAPQAATVAANGAWGVPIGSLFGTHTWQAAASWGSQMQQAPSSGRFLRATDTRLSGPSRYETAIAISQYAFPGTPNVPVVYIAGGAGFPDALSAGPAARAEGGPLLLTEATTLPLAVRNELTRLNPDEIVVVGGTGVVSAGVFSALGAYAPEVTRVSGASRYQTSQAIAQRVLTQGGFTTGQPLWVATGTGYADALSAGAAAAVAGVPILLVDGGLSSIPTSTRTFIDDTLQSSEVYIAGGTGVVSAGIASAIDAIPGVTVQRFGGAGRFDTSRLINEFAHPTSAPEVFLTYGFNFPDALAGGVLSGLVGGPLYITDTPCVQSAIVDDILDLGPAKVTVLGGTALLSNNARDLKRC
ncbi:cell wall-binding repeat-containing protein [Microcella sp.]|uniref:cell wall-binding repeat-containing protein n=1 Tax=Microcella sp. TaxID=1913979 RepID=UPI00256D0989|nr:cell wall-binding repeat-containing protein [Microcella sp.]MBX9472734.1 cell wall-binding repeat-containing protein [Microcella sp.]